MMKGLEGILSKNRLIGGIVITLLGIPLLIWEIKLGILHSGSCVGCSQGEIILRLAPGFFGLGLFGIGIAIIYGYFRDKKEYEDIKYNIKHNIKN